ncbi:hypothetical protein [Pseudotabrizicola alkalilacus]|uniref:Uncharacterized protein n=1 Tax=Pseudotabrizicola alkalilacus TaxID=2305252 RepID=A0A411Z3W1_9RHOB|nr:hypothetical protein [Pseudotabrizicola alkalilacus]RGP37735.1 hypothetical protein D1012_07420 [Pseudotabrizicola alkalilacus]
MFLVNFHEIVSIGVEMKSLGYRILGAAVGFLVGSVAILLLYFVFHVAMEALDVNRVRVRVPVILIVLPFVTAFYGFKIGPELFAAVQEFLGDAGPLTRLVMIGPVFWAAVVLAYVFVFEPFGYSISDDEWLLAAKIILFPTGVLWAGIWVARRFIMQPRA